MSPLERVLAEEWPDGTFGGRRPETARYRPRHDPAADRHRTDLEHALDGTEWHQPIPSPLAARHRADLAAAIRQPATRQPAA